MQSQIRPATSNCFASRLEMFPARRNAWNRSTIESSTRNPAAEQEAVPASARVIELRRDSPATSDRHFSPRNSGAQNFSLRGQRHPRRRSFVLGNANLHGVV